MFASPDTLFPFFFFLEVKFPSVCVFFGVGDLALFFFSLCAFFFLVRLFFLSTVLTFCFLIHACMRISLHLKKKKEKKVLIYTVALLFVIIIIVYLSLADAKRTVLDAGTIQGSLQTLLYPFAGSDKRLISLFLFSSATLFSFATTNTLVVAVCLAAHSSPSLKTT